MCSHSQIQPGASASGTPWTICICRPSTPAHRSAIWCGPRTSTKSSLGSGPELVGYPVLGGITAIHSPRWAHMDIHWIRSLAWNGAQVGMEYHGIRMFQHLPISDHPLECEQNASSLGLVRLGSIGGRHENHIKPIRNSIVWYCFVSWRCNQMQWQKSRTLWSLNGLLDANEKWKKCFSGGWYYVVYLVYTLYIL